MEGSRSLHKVFFETKTLKQTPIHVIPRLQPEALVIRNSLVQPVRTQASVKRVELSTKTSRSTLVTALRPKANARNAPAPNARTRRSPKARKRSRLATSATARKSTRLMQVLDGSGLLRAPIMPRRTSVQRIQKGQGVECLNLVKLGSSTQFKHTA